MTKGGGTELDTTNIEFTRDQLIEAILPETVSRRIFPIFTVLEIHKQNYTFFELLNDIGTKYDFDPYEYGRNVNALKETTVPIPLIYHEATYNKMQLKRINDTKAPLSERIRQMGRVFNRDEDNIAIAGESTKTGVTSIADTTNNTTVADAHLNLTTIDTLITTFHGIINQLNNGLTANSGSQTVRNFPCIALMTSDVESRLWVTPVTATSPEGQNGYQVFKSILEERCGPGSEIVVNNALGGTVTTVDDRVSLAAGTTNFALMAKSPNHYGMVASEMFTDTETNIKGFTQEFAERWRPIFFKQESIIFSGTVDITS
ncbi:hypothetical protein LCGC14_1861870, partial [marine sediment metagenome]